MTAAEYPQRLHNGDTDQLFKQGGTAREGVADTRQRKRQEGCEATVVQQQRRGTSDKR